jgi:methyl-accepting chemotaxis protein
VENTTKENMTLLCEKNARVMNLTFSTIESSVSTLAHYVVENLPSTEMLLTKSGTEYEKCMTSINRVAFNHATSLGYAAAVYIIFDPDQYDDLGSYYVANEQNQLVSQPLSYMSTMTQSGNDWWDVPTHTQMPSWIEGDYNQNERRKDHYFSYVAPMYFDDKLLGVAGMDFSYTLLQDLASSIQILDSGFATIIDSNRNFVSHPSFQEGVSASQLFKGESFTMFKDSLENCHRSAFISGSYDINNALSKDLLSFEREGETRLT